MKTENLDSVSDSALGRALLLLRPRKHYALERWSVVVSRAELISLILLKAEIATETERLTVRERRLIMEMRRSAKLRFPRRKGKATRMQIFAENIRQLLDRRGLSQREAADSWGIPYKLLRRWTTAGIAQPSSRTADELEIIRKEMGLAEVAALWTEQTIELTEIESKIEEQLQTATLPKIPRRKRADIGNAVPIKATGDMFHRIVYERQHREKIAARRLREELSQQEPDTATVEDLLKQMARKYRNTFEQAVEKVGEEAIRNAIKNALMEGATPDLVLQRISEWFGEDAEDDQ